MGFVQITAIRTNYNLQDINFWNGKCVNDVTLHTHNKTTCFY